MARMLSMTLLVLFVLVCNAAGQESYPTRPITIVVPFPPGGIADLTARPLASVFERILKQPVVVANKTGAAGAVGMQSAAIAKPDGYTLMVALVSISTIPEVDALFGRNPAFTRDQFVGIARLNADPPILVVGADTPWKNLKELVEDGKKRPGEITYSSSGVYGASHVPMEMFLQAAGLNMRHLPTTGGAPAMTAVLGGHAAMWASPPAIAVPHLKAAKIRALATWGATRLAAFPDIPTMKELGYNIEYYLWTGLFAPKNVPANVVKVLRDATRQAVHDREFNNAMEKIQTPIAYQDAEEFRAWWDRDAQILAGVIKRIGKIESK
jgi:tripartite-type tricarboxylate transporter receptor subunit TctC